MTRTRYSRPRSNRTGWMAVVPGCIRPVIVVAASRAVVAPGVDGAVAAANVSAPPEHQG